MFSVYLVFGFLAGVFANFPVGAPVQPGADPNCAFWGIASPGDICEQNLKGLNGLDLETFYDLNPQLSRDCQHNFWAGYAYCVGSTVSFTGTTGNPTVVSNVPVVVTATVTATSKRPS